MECPNCKSQMLNYKSINEPGELWHVCSKCNISFTQRQHRYFTKMIKRLINEDSNTFLNNQYER
jgi:transposase-like protein